MGRMVACTSTTQTPGDPRVQRWEKIPIQSSDLTAKRQLKPLPTKSPKVASALGRTVENSKLKHAHLHASILFGSEGEVHGTLYESIPLVTELDRAFFQTEIIDISSDCHIL